MEAFSTMIPTTYPPVGRRLYMGLSSRSPLPVFPGFRAVWVNSGTAALALAIKLAWLESGSVAGARVILPAYGCPDLVAAAEFAGVQPVLVDIGESDPGYNLECLTKALDERVVAVVAVNFLGVRERLAAIKQCVKERSNAIVIEDNAQWFPEAAQNDVPLQTQLALTSFGRGKPVNLMGGGVLWVQDTITSHLENWMLGQGFKLCVEAGTTFPFRAKAALFNQVLHPAVYHWVARLPFLNVGETLYHPLEGIVPLDGERAGLAASNICAYLSSSRHVELQYKQALEGAPVTDLVARCAARSARLLRYPALLRSPGKAVNWDSLNRLGVSQMYKQPLIEIPGVKNRVVDAVDYPGAAAFASRLLTMPVQPATPERVIEKIIAAL